MSLHNVQNFWWFIFLLHIVIRIIDANNGHKAKLPVVIIPQGPLRGITLESRHNRSIYSFLGIPYAQPPIGNLRFSHPAPANRWNNTLKANKEGNSCPQVLLSGDEDCLYLNVYTPQLPKHEASSLLPVIVYIHGGGFVIGNGDSSYYGPNYLVDADLLLVTLNYRLGPFGFFTTGDEVAPGNWGLKDQVLALKWVRNNIKFFGGDPNQVTIVGHSAGAASVNFLTLSSSTTGLFHRYIAQSGSMFAFWEYQPRSIRTNVSQQLAGFVGCPTNTSSLLVDCLRNLTVSEIMNTVSNFSNSGYRYPLFVWGPTDEPDIEGAFLVDSPENLLAAGKFHDLPSIVGTVPDECVMIMPGVFENHESFDEFSKNFDKSLPDVLQVQTTLKRVQNVSKATADIKKFYFNNDLTSNRTRVWYDSELLMSNALFHYPAYKAIEKRLKFAKNIPFFYSFEYRGSYSVGEEFKSNDVLNTTVVHGDELLYLFPQTLKPENMSETDLLVLDTMVQLWTSFVINGTPKTEATISNTTWLPYSLEKKNYLQIGRGSDGTMNLRYDFNQERMQFWEYLTTTGSGSGAIHCSIVTSILLFFIVSII